MTRMDAPAAMVDVAFPLAGHRLPREHRYALADAIAGVLPWFAADPRCGVHAPRLVTAGAGEALVSPRTRLVLRVPRERAADVAQLAGAELPVGSDRLRTGEAQLRELLPHGTLYAPLVCADGADEAAFLQAAQAELAALDVRGQAVCGRWQLAEAGRLVGCSLMLAGLGRTESLRLQERGLGPHRSLGCGLFVGHKSAAAVGVPD